GHARTDSKDSEDPLTWSTERYEKETAKGVDTDSITDWSEWIWNEEHNRWG
ncbi:hypothetical protein BJ875DRAFT_348330, partial [Amylocarpus encephaloides]